MWHLYFLIGSLKMNILLLNQIHFIYAEFSYTHPFLLSFNTWDVMGKPVSVPFILLF